MPPATNAMIFCFLLTCLVVYYITERARLNGEREREREETKTLIAVGFVSSGLLCWKRRFSKLVFF